MRSITIILLCISLLTLQAPNTHAQKWEKTLAKADAEYMTGAYKKAKKILDKFKVKVIKKMGANNPYMPEYYLRAARFELALGYLVNFNNNIDLMIQSSAAQYGEQSTEHALNLIRVAEIMVQYGNYLQAHNYLTDAKKLLENQPEYDEYTKAKVALTEAEVLTGRGFYADAQALLEKHHEYFRSRAVNKESFLDDEGNLKTRRLSEEETADRMEDYARLLTTKSNTLRLKGDFKSADSAFVRSEEWIADNLGKKDMKYVENQFLHGKLLVENGIYVDRMPKETRFDKTLDKLKKDYEESHYMAFNLYETLLKQYLYTNEKGKYRAIKSEYERAIKKNFKKTSLHYINLETIEFDSKLTKDKTKNIGSEAAAILASTRALPADHEKRISLLRFLYNLAIQKRDYVDAESYLTEILSIKKNLYGEDSPEYHLTKLELANYHVNFSDNLAQAYTIYNESFHGIVKEQVDTWHKDYVNVLNNLAKYHTATDEYDKAATALDEALFVSRAKFDNQDPDYGLELAQIANLQITLADYENAEKNILDAVRILESVKKDDYRVVDYITALETQAKLYAIQGLFDEAEHNIDQAKKLLKKADEVVVYDELAATDELASLYITLGKYTETEALLDNLIKSYEKRYGTTSRRLIEPLINKGRLLLITGEYPEAEKVAMRAESIASSVYQEGSSKFAPIYLLLAEIHISIGDYEKAEGTIQRAIEIQRKQFGSDHVDVGKALKDLALIKFHSGDNIQDVDRIMEEAKSIIEEKLGNRNPTYAKLLTEQARIYISSNRLDEAFNSLTLAESIWAAKVGRRNNINTAAIYTLIGDIHYFQREYDKAEEQYEKSKRLYQKFFNKNHPEYVKIISKLAKVYFMEGNSKLALEHIEEALANYQNFIRDYFPALSEREKAKYWNTIKPDYEFYNTVAFTLKHQNAKILGKVYNNALLTKAILLNSSIKIRERIMNSGDKELRSMYNDWVDKKEQLTSAISLSAEQLAENQIDVGALKNEVERLEKELSEKSELFSSSFEEKKIEWENVQNALAPNEVAVEMVRYRHFDHIFTDSVVYAALYLKNDQDFKHPEAIMINNGQQLETRYFKNYRNSIIFRLTDEVSYEHYWKPLEEVVGPYATIYLSADGVYNQINLEAIPTPDGRYVLDKSNVIMVSNTKDIYLRKVKTQLIQEEKRATMFGNPDFYMTASAGDINPLPGTEKELKELRKLLKQEGWIANTFTEQQANEEQIKRLDNPRIFHIATHGFFSPQKELKSRDEMSMSEAEASQNPLLRTGLLLTGAGDVLNETSYNYNKESGILTAYEAMNLNLDQTDLVVLSACETGLGELAVGEGVYGLQRAFLVAGAKTLIMSMFKVDDDATQQLMITFYRKWLETGRKRESFVQAKKELRIDYPDPIYWGAFIMIGLD